MIDPLTPIGKLFLEGSIEVRIARFKSNTVKVCIGAPAGILVLREELVNGT